MPTIRLTDRAIRAIKPPETGQRDYFDSGDRGLHVRVSAAGTKSFGLKYVFDGRQKRATLGRYPDLPLAEARAKAAEWRRKVGEGIDPVEEQRQARDERQQAQANTYEAVVEDFIEKYAKPRQRTWKETRRVLLNGCADWKPRAFTSITKRDVYAMLDGFMADGHHYKASVTLSWLRTLWGWANSRDITTDPFMSTVKIEATTSSRTRIYDEAELRGIWTAANALSAVEGAYVKLVLLLGVRRKELAGMRRSEFDDAAAPTVWTVPFERTKSRRTAKPRVYPTPLPPLAQRIIKGIPESGVPESADLVFPSRRHGVALDIGRPFAKSVRQASGVSDWSPHTHRHTVTSWLQDKGYSEYERGLVLNHSSSGVTADYSHGYPMDLKRSLLEAWAEHIEQLVTAGGVRLLR